MGKKKRHADDAPKALPVFHIKKKKLMEETSLTAVVALHKYCHRFKIGTPGFREKNANPFLVTCVMDGSECVPGDFENSLIIAIPSSLPRVAGSARASTPTGTRPSSRRRW